MAGDRKVKKNILEMAEKIASEYKPEKIILFGSYASGKPSKDSDIDILIVTKKCLSPEENYERQRQFSKDFSMPVQFVCVGSEEFTETKDVIGGITYPASKYGEILYEKP